METSGVDTWMPIETAPKSVVDNILGYVPAQKIVHEWGVYTIQEEFCVVYWDAQRGAWIESTGEQYQAYDPTMWQPLVRPKGYSEHGD